MTATTVLISEMAFSAVEAHCYVRPLKGSETLERGM